MSKTAVPVMKVLPTIVVAALGLGACHSKPEIIDTTAPDPMASQLMNAEPVELPPPITASISFRCKDNSVVYVDFFKGGRLASLRFKRSGSPIQLAGKVDEPLTGGGYSISGNEHKITLTEPHKVSLTCIH